MIVKQYFFEERQPAVQSFYFLVTNMVSSNSASVSLRSPYSCCSVVTHTSTQVCALHAPVTAVRHFCLLAGSVHQGHSEGLISFSLRVSDSRAVTQTEAATF